jgi:hypothetical protein
MVRAHGSICEGFGFQGLLFLGDVCLGVLRAVGVVVIGAVASQGAAPGHRCFRV